MFNHSWYRPSKKDYQKLIAIWEAAVRATHHFLTEEDIAIYKELILTSYFDEVDLYCSMEETIITGFLGLSGDTIQMLFIDPKFHGNGIGKKLIRFAIEDKACTKVDVNEQNKQAVGFYEYLGFITKQRFEEDAAGKQYPILAMELNY